MRNWFAVHTKSRCEEIARANLARQGYEIYAPRLLVRRRRGGAWVKAVEPLFPRYLFICVDPDRLSLAPVRSTVGVADLVRFGERLRTVPDEVIVCLKALEDPDCGLHVADPWPYRPGDRVEILDGPLAGLGAVFQCASGGGRARVLLELLGRRNAVDLALEALGAEE